MFVDMARVDGICFEEEIKINLIVATNFSVDFRKYITYFQISLECGHLFL
jgi:hypothetical protein